MDSVLPFVTRLLGGFIRDLFRGDLSDLNLGDQFGSLGRSWLKIFFFCFGRNEVLLMFI